MSAPEALPPPHLFASNVTVVRGGRVLFQNLGFAVWRGQALLLKGPNGAGKTSLLLAIAGVLRPESGAIEYRIDGVSADLRPEAHVLLPQNALKARMTVAENLAFWRAMNAPTGVAAGVALERVGLGGLGAIEAGHLSTGQLRRLALARLLVSKRTIWLLDEPTAALDAEGETLVAALLDEHCREGGIAVVATHHDLGLSDLGERLSTIRIADGRAAFEGIAP